MSQDTNTITPSDLEQIREQLAALQAAQDRSAAEKAGAEKIHFPDVPEPKGFAGHQLKAQNALLELRRRAAEDVEADYQAHFAGTAAKRERLERELEKVAERRREEEKRHQEALEPLDQKCNELRKQHDALFKAPISLSEVLARPEYAEQRERINREFVAEQLPIGTGVTVEQVIEGRRWLSKDQG